jgi:hypothetical protein
VIAPAFIANAPKDFPAFMENERRHCYSLFDADEQTQQNLVIMYFLFVISCRNVLGLVQASGVGVQTIPLETQLLAA